MVDVFAPERLRGRFWEPKWSQKRGQKHRKSIQKSMENSVWNFMDFGLILEVILEAFWSPFCLIFAVDFRIDFCFEKMPQIAKVRNTRRDAQAWAGGFRGFFYLVSHATSRLQAVGGGFNRFAHTAGPGERNRLVHGGDWSMGR